MDRLLELLRVRVDWLNRKGDECCSDYYCQNWGRAGCKLYTASMCEVMELADEIERREPCVFIDEDGNFRRFEILDVPDDVPPLDSFL